MENKPIYITTPIYYVNDVPHLGHAYTTIAADILSRYYKAQGKEVFFMTGTDEHGAKIAESARKQSMEPIDFVNNLAPKFEEAWKKLNIDFDAFFRTTDSKHEAAVQEFVLKLQESGYIEKRKYEGQYCVGCEKYITPDELTEEGLCPDHNKEPICQTEENYFFLLSKLSEKLQKAIESNEFIIGPDSRRNEVLGKIKQGLEDVSISRQAVEWGIPYPTDPDQTIYVWIDALLNYVTAEKVFDEKIWPADIHLMAKDILWFHAVIWPAILMALDLPLPKKVFAHGFFTFNGKKMSKSIGNVIDPIEMSKKYGADAVRYALFREFPFGEDGDISEEKIALRYNTELASGIGNLVSRVCAMTEKYLHGKVPNVDRDPESHPLRTEGWKKTYAEYDNAISNLKFDEALMAINKFIGMANKYIDDSEPWRLHKEGKENELQWVLYGLLDSIHQISFMIYPFMPETSKRIRESLDIQNDLILFENSYVNIGSGKNVKKPENLFPRIDKFVA